jgi:hypothetical protein
MRYLSGLRLLGGLIVAVGLSSACSLVYDLSSDQCELDTDCDALGGDFRGRKCVAGVCLASGGGATGGSGGMSAGGCASTAECQKIPENFGNTVCIEGQCVPLTNGTTCPVVMPRDPSVLAEVLARPAEPIILGAFVSLGVTQESSLSINIDLAVSEFNEASDGVQSADGPRAFIAVACDTPFEDTHPILEEAMDHLVDSLKVPGIVALLLYEDLSYAFEYKRNVAEPPFWMSSFESDSVLIARPDGGLMWHIMPTGEEVALPVKPTLTRVLDSLALDEPARVALITDTGNRACNDMTTTVLDETNGRGIVFNGKTALANGDQAFRSYTARETDTRGDLEDVVEDLLDFRPHVILVNTTDLFYSQIFEPLEEVWLARTENQRRPFYLVAPHHFGSEGLFGKINSVRSRIAGVNTSIGNPLLVRDYFRRLGDAYPELAAPGYENFYDAPYYVMYAAADRVDNVPRLRGADLVDGMRNLIDLDAPAHEVGNEGVPATLQDLGRGPIRLDGLLGAPNWNPDTGGRTTPGSVWCVDGSSNLVSDAYKYDEASGDIVLGVDGDNQPYAESPCAAEF